MAALVSADLTSKEEAAGLAVHLHLRNITNSQRPWGSQWLEYHKNFREWAAARGIRWGS